MASPHPLCLKLTVLMDLYTLAQAVGGKGKGLDCNQASHAQIAPVNAMRLGPVLA